jgi:hypothetical protein
LSPTKPEMADRRKPSDQKMKAPATNAIAATIQSRC